MSTLFQRLDKSIERLPPNTVFLLGLAYVAAVGAASFFAPDAMSLTLLFVLGSVFVGWGAGQRRSAIVSLVACLLMGIHDWFHPRALPLPAWLVDWNIATRFLVVGGSGWLAAEASRLTHDLFRLVDERTAQWKAEAEQHKATSNAMKRGEEALKRQAWILENMGEAMIATTLDGIVELTNPAAERLTGYAAGELVGKSVTLLSPFPESETAEKFRSLQKRFEGKTLWYGEIPIRKKDGRTLIAQVNLTLLKSGERTVMIALYHDVTERLRAESQLRAREERIQLGLEAGRMITWDLDPASGTISYSESLKSFLGGQDIEPYRDIVSYMRQIHPEDLEKAALALQTALKHGSPSEHEYRVRHPDGTYHWYLTKGRAVHDSVGHPIRAVGVSVDITERKRAEASLRENEEALRESEQTYRALIETTGTGYLILDVRGRVQDANA